jgi:hypothetical protein
MLLPVGGGTFKLCVESRAQLDVEQERRQKTHLNSTEINDIFFKNWRTARNSACRTDQGGVVRHLCDYAQRWASAAGAGPA